MQIPPPLPPRQSREIVTGFLWITGVLIVAMFIFGLQGRDYQAFEKMAWAIVGALFGALKLQPSSNQ